MNIVVAVTAKETFKVPHVVARIYESTGRGDLSARGNPDGDAHALGGEHHEDHAGHGIALPRWPRCGSGEVESVMPRGLRGPRGADGSPTSPDPPRSRSARSSDEGQAVIPSPETQSGGRRPARTSRRPCLPSRKLEKLIAH
ncbi:MAG: hypothetical protein MZV64_70545 [Ignavibacteriales bacterium]|nr:hypothetical protein [Ignavibacteriales bacterium]